MRKFIKYEIRGTYRFILGLLAILVIAFSLIQLKVKSEISNFLMNPSSIINPFEFVALISILVIFGAFITAFFYIIGSFRKELYEDRGYLTFTLPLTGNQILGGKLLVALLWFFTIAIVTVLYNVLLAAILFKLKLSFFMEMFGVLVSSWGLAYLIKGIISSVLTLTIIYFSISLSKVTFKNKKVGGFWFIAFLIIHGLVSYIINRVNLALPYYLDMNTFKFTNPVSFMELYGKSFGLTGWLMNIIPVNIYGTLTELIIATGMFFGTSHMIEKRIDL